MNHPIITIKTYILLITISLGLGACSNTTTKPKPEKNTAAQYNARLGAEYTRTGRLTLANEKLQKALQQNPNSAEAHHYYALLQQQLEQTALADKHFRRAMQLTPKDPQLLNNYGSHLCKNGHYQAASKLFMAALNDPLYTTPEFAYTNAGICIKKSGNTQQAEKYFRKSLEVKPSFSSALYQMALLEFEQGDYARAQAFLQRYHEKHREAAETLSLCVKINSKLGDFDTAEQCNNKLAGRFPGNKQFAEFGS